MRCLVGLFLLLSFYNSQGEANSEIKRMKERSARLTRKLDGHARCMLEKSGFAKNRQSIANIERLKGALADEIKHKRMSREEMVLFLAQVFHESGAFSQTIEVGTDKRFKRLGYGNEFKGRGLIQLTGCSNYITFLNNLNTGGAEWNEVWPLDSKTYEKLSLSDKKGLVCYRKNSDGKCIQFQIGGKKCSPGLLLAFKAQYQTDFQSHYPEGMKGSYQGELDPFNILGNDDAFKIGNTVIAKNGASLTSEQLIVKSAVGFWSGKKSCQRIIKNVVRAEKVKIKYEPEKIPVPCVNYRTRSRQQCIKILSISKCVNGGTKGLEDRVLWYKAAQQCVHSAFR